MRITKRTHVTRIVAIMMVAALAAGAAPAMASALGEAARTGGAVSVFSSSLPNIDTAVTVTDKLNRQTLEVSAVSARAERRASRVQAPLPRPVTRSVASASASAGGTQARTSTAGNTTTAASSQQQGTTTTSTQPAAAAAAPAPAPSSSIEQARAILANRAATWKYVAGTTVEFGDTRGNPQAIVFYKSKRIIINPNHTVSLERIIDHEIWHIIDYHHNGQINWGESVPPSNAGDFRL